jgi:SAM-dependent methyltransferase
MQTSATFGGSGVVIGDTDRAPTASNSVWATLERHRSVWAKKASLRGVYESYFRRILDSCSPMRPILELGSGPGFFKEYCPEIMATDIAPTPWIDAVVDGCCLPYGNGSVGNIVMIDVFHHIAQPQRFLEEACRVLSPGGRIVMIEPWTSAVGYLFYRYVHHEDADRSVDPMQPFADEKDAFEGNAALPMIFFDDRGRSALGRVADGRLCLIQMKRMPAVSWLLTGGFRPYGLLPGPVLPLARCIDGILSPFSRWCAFRAMIVVERSTCESGNR